MRLLEYQAKRLFEQAGIPIPDGAIADTPQQAEEVAQTLAGPVMVKAQVRAGGRGKAGGVIRAADPPSASRAAARLLGHQIGDLKVNRVLVERALEVKRELFVGVTIDYDAARPLVLLGSEGGVDVERDADDPGRLARLLIHPTVGLPSYACRDLLRRAGLEPGLGQDLVPVLRTLYGSFAEWDALLAEINLLVETTSGDIFAADACIVVDDAALRRQPELVRLADESPDESLEERVKREHDFDLVVIDPQGDIGLVSTGAGGTMMTVDLIQRAGGRPFNFADVRTGRLLGDPTRLIVLLNEIVARPTIKCVLVSVFGAITDLEECAQTLGRALDEVTLAVPMIVRLDGYKAAEARALLSARGLRCFVDLEEAIGTAVNTARGNQTGDPGR